MAQTTPDVRRLGLFSLSVPSFFLPVAYFVIYNLYMHLNISYLMRIKEKHTSTAQSYHHSLWFQTQLCLPTLPGVLSKVLVDDRATCHSELEEIMEIMKEMKEPCK